MAKIAANCDVAVITAGRGGRPGETRLDLLTANASIVREIAKQFAGSQATLVVVTNPVDVMTHVAGEASGLPRGRVIGTGTMLDSARLKQVLGRELGVDATSVHAQVVGEHGDSEVCLWSSAQVGGRLLREWDGWTRDREKQCADEVRTAAYEIIKRKGATNHAIGLVTAELLQVLIRGERRVLTVSSRHNRVGDIDDVTLSLPALVSERGAERVILPAMNEDEATALRNSAKVLRDALRSLST